MRHNTYCTVAVLGKCKDSNNDFGAERRQQCTNVHRRCVRIPVAHPGAVAQVAVGGMRCRRCKVRVRFVAVAEVRAGRGHGPRGSCDCVQVAAGIAPAGLVCGWAEARIKIARVTWTIKLDRNWNRFQLANSAPPLSVTDSAIAPSARMWRICMPST